MAAPRKYPDELLNRPPAAEQAQRAADQALVMVTKQVC